MKVLFASLLMTVPLIARALDNTDAQFYKDAAEGNMAEVELGHLAQDNSDNARVKHFGAVMVSDHSSADEKLRSLATERNVTLPAHPSAAQVALTAKLAVLSGKTFDKSYIKSTIKDHEADIAIFKREIAEGQDPDAKAFAAVMLPMLQAHLNALQTISTESDAKRD
jgi:putative membrane protein